MFLRNVEHKKYIDIVSKYEEETPVSKQTGSNQYLAGYLKPIMRNEKEKNEHALFKLY